MTEPTIKQILDSWFDDGRVPFHRENARFWEDSAGATIVMLCDRLDAAEQRHEAYVRHTTEQLRSQRERLVAAQERIRELEEACAGLRMMKESYKRRLSDLQRETYR